MNDNKDLTKDELVERIARLIVFWSISALLYFAVIHESIVAWWILGSLVVMKVYSIWKKDFDNDKDN
jgi:hypothetical protein